MEFKLPELGEGVVEGELIQWLVKEGDSVSADQPLLEVMTDKATVEVPSTGSGVIKGLKAKAGDMIKVGSVLATIEGGAAVSESPKASEKTTQAGLEKAPAEKSAPVAASPTPPAPATPSRSPVASSSGPYVGATESLSAASVPAAPIVRSMAQKAGVDLAQVSGSGPVVGDKARVLEEDLLRFLNGAGQSSYSYGHGAVVAGAPSPVPAKSTKVQPLPATFQRGVSAGSQEVERQPVRGLRRVIAQAMVKSKYTAPHYSYVDEFECESLVAVREQAKLIGEKYGVKITYLPFIVKAVVGALKEFPVVNSSLEETEAGLELVYKKFYNIGFAVATKDGLIVPVIKNADQKNIMQIAIEMTELSEKVRAGKASADELKGSTFSITSMGNIGGLFATPIINYPEVGILGVYKVQEKPIVREGLIVAGKTMHLSLSLDHRVVDGAVGGHFCNAIIERLQNPARLLLEL